MKRPSTRYLTLGAAVAAFAALNQLDIAQARSEPPACSYDVDDSAEPVDGEDAREAALLTRD